MQSVSYTHLDVYKRQLVMILVDTSVWIGLLRNSDRPAVNALKRLLNSETTVALTPIILQEILQGARSDAHFATLQRYFADLPMLKPGDATATSIAAAQIYCCLLYTSRCV